MRSQAETQAPPLSLEMQVCTATLSSSRSERPLGRCGPSCWSWEWRSFEFVEEWRETRDWRWAGTVTDPEEAGWVPGTSQSEAVEASSSSLCHPMQVWLSSALELLSSAVDG